MKLNRDQVHSTSYNKETAKTAERALKKLKSDLQYVLLGGSHRGLMVEEKMNVTVSGASGTIVNRLLLAFDVFEKDYDYTKAKSKDSAPIALKEQHLVSIPMGGAQEALANEAGIIINHINHCLAQIKHFKENPDPVNALNVKIVINELITAVQESNLVQYIKNRTLEEKIGDIFKEFITSIKRFFEEHLLDHTGRFEARSTHFDQTFTMYNQKRAEKQATQEVNPDDDASAEELPKPQS